MMPPAPLTDDWLYWDPETILGYPHSHQPRAEPREPEQLDLFDALNKESPLSLDGRAVYPRRGTGGEGEEKERLAKSLQSGR
jgi:hypothetical protein